MRTKSLMALFVIGLYCAAFISAAESVEFVSLEEEEENELEEEEDEIGVPLEKKPKLKIKIEKPKKLK